ncbi:MAG: Acetokinase family [Parachlamydiales bacterium]|nr:Acetokinase family [Parachlamydiales bacterium]
MLFVNMRKSLSLQRFAFLGIDIDPDQNEQTKARDADISSKNAKVRTLVIHTEEAFEIARECGGWSSNLNVLANNTLQIISRLQKLRLKKMF